MSRAFTDPGYLLIFAGIGACIFSACVLVLLRTTKGPAQKGLAAIGAVILLVSQAINDLKTWDAYDSFAIEYQFANSSLKFGNEAQRQAGDLSQPDVLKSAFQSEASEFFSTLSIPNVSSDKLAEDVAVVAFLSYFSRRRFDWQLSTVSLTAPSLLAFEAAEGRSQQHECERFSEEALRTILRNAKNMFAELPRLSSNGSLCLPPGTSISVDPARIAIDGPFARLSLSIQGTRLRRIMPALGTPNSGEQDSSRPDERLVIEARSLVRQKALTSRHDYAPKVRQWLDDVRRELIWWFGPCSFTEQLDQVGHCQVGRRN